MPRTPSHLAFEYCQIKSPMNERLMDSRTATDRSVGPASMLLSCWWQDFKTRRHTIFVYVWTNFRLQWVPFAVAAVRWNMKTLSESGGPSTGRIAQPCVEVQRTFQKMWHVHHGHVREGSTTENIRRSRLIRLLYGGHKLPSKQSPVTSISITLSVSTQSFLLGKWQ